MSKKINDEDGLDPIAQAQTSLSAAVAGSEAGDKYRPADDTMLVKYKKKARDIEAEKQQME